MLAKTLYKLGDVSGGRDFNIVARGGGVEGGQFRSNNGNPITTECNLEGTM
jgi:hypothetical protein